MVFIDYMWNDATEAQVAIVQGLITIFTSLIVPAAVWMVQRAQIKVIEKREAETNKEVMEGPDDRSVAPNELSYEDTKPTDNRTALKENWSQIKARLISVATNEKIDGRTRAKYARLDYRAGYKELIDKLSSDEYFNKDQAGKYLRANNLWMSHRANQAEVTDSDVYEMEKLRRELAGE